MKQRFKRKRIGFGKRITALEGFLQYLQNDSIELRNNHTKEYVEYIQSTYLHGWCDLFARRLSRKLKLPIESIIERHTHECAGLVHAFVHHERTCIALDAKGIIAKSKVIEYYQIDIDSEYVYIFSDSERLLTTKFSSRKNISTHNYQTYKRFVNQKRKECDLIIREVYLRYFKQALIAYGVVIT